MSYVTRCFVSDQIKFIKKIKIYLKKFIRNKKLETNFESESNFKYNFKYNFIKSISSISFEISY